MKEDDKLSNEIKDNIVEYVKVNMEYRLKHLREVEKMYQQYRLIDNEYIHISSSGRPDEDNEKILNGDFLDKTPLIAEQGEIPFTTPSRDELLKQIFSDWQVGDILYIGSGKLENPIWDNGTLREKSREEQIILDNKIELLYDGEVLRDGGIVKIEPTQEFYMKVWNKVSEVWEESSQSKALYEKDIDNLKDQILENGFVFTDLDGITHRQKSRDKDKTNLESIISAMEEYGINEYYWYFDVNDNPLLTLADYKEMKKQGFIFNGYVFAVENQLKKLAPSRNIDFNEYKNRVNALSTVKCFE